MLRLEDFTCKCPTPGVQGKNRPTYTFACCRETKSHGVRKTEKVQGQPMCEADFLDWYCNKAPFWCRVFEALI